PGPAGCQRAPCSPFPSALSQDGVGELQASVEQGEGVFLPARSVLKPIGDDGQMKETDRVSAQITQFRNLPLFLGFAENTLDKAQIAEIQLLRLQPERVEPGDGLQGAQVNGPDEIFVS